MCHAASVSSKSSKRRGRPIVVDGTKYHWKVRTEYDQVFVDVLLPTGRRIRNLVGWAWGHPAITPSAVATFIRCAA